MEFQVTWPNKHLDSHTFAADNPGCHLYQRENDLFVDGCDSLEQAEQLLAAHNPPEPPNVDAARDAAIAHAKSLGFTDEMIAVMYPGLTV